MNHVEHLTDRELLVLVLNNQDRDHKDFVEHTDKDIRIQETLQKSVTAVHRRIDGLFISGVLAVAVLGITLLVKMLKG